MFTMTRKTWLLCFVILTFIKRNALCFSLNSDNQCNCQNLADLIENVKKDFQQSIENVQSECNKELQEHKQLIKGLETLIEDQREAIGKLENHVGELKDTVHNMLNNKSPSEFIGQEEKALLKESTSETVSSSLSVDNSTTTDDIVARAGYSNKPSNNRHSSKPSRRPSKKNKNKNGAKDEWPKLSENDSDLTVSGCIIDLKVHSPKYPPHLIDENGQLIHPVLQGRSRVIFLNTEEKVTVACLGRTNNSFTTIVGKQLALATCARNTSLLLENGVELSYSQLGCTNQNKEVLVEAGTCANNLGTLVKIGWQAGDDFIPLYEACHDKSSQVNYYSTNTIIGRSTDADDKANTRPSFRQAGYYPGIDVHAAFNQAQQNRTIAQIVGSESLAVKYFNVQKNFFLARGHLAPDGDFIDAASQDATYYYINMAPQWQSFNGGNWNYLEAAVRRIATERDIDLTVYTGTFGISTLTDKNGMQQPHYLSFDRNNNGILPVPKYYWKLIHDPGTNTATAVVGVNNPHVNELRSHEILCEDVCNQVPWITWKKNDFVKGYTFCCTASGLHKAIEYAPFLGDLPLLL